MGNRVCIFCANPADPAFLEGNESEADDEMMSKALLAELQKLAAQARELVTA